MLRPATPEDAEAMARVVTAAQANRAWMPPLHTAEENERFVRETLLLECEIWVEDVDGAENTEKTPAVRYEWRPPSVD